MFDIRSLIALRRTHRYANTKPWAILNELLSAVLDAVDLSIFRARTLFNFRKTDLSAHLALLLFTRIVHRHMADLEAGDKLALSNNFRETLSKVAAIAVLKKLYPIAENIYSLRYLDFLYWRIAESRQNPPIVDVLWNEPGVFGEICDLPNSCVILALHNGFAHCARAFSHSKKRLAAVIGFPDLILQFYKRNKVYHPDDIEIVPVNNETLLKLTEVAKRNKAIICAPDVINPNTGRCDLVSLGMFYFAKYANLPVYFFDFCVDEDCALRGFIRGPIETDVDPLKAAEAFIRFCRSVSGRAPRVIDKRSRQDAPSEAKGL